VFTCGVRYFSDHTLFRLNVNPNKYFMPWVVEKKSAMLVSGSFGRSGLSQFFKMNSIKDEKSVHKLTVFIAHK